MQGREVSLPQQGAGQGWGSKKGGEGQTGVSKKLETLKNWLQNSSQSRKQSSNKGKRMWKTSGLGFREMRNKWDTESAVEGKK